MKHATAGITLLADFRPLEVLWTGSKPPYPSEQSARWALRQHRQALLDGNALALLRGRIFVHPERLVQVIETEALGAIKRRESGGKSGGV